MRWLFVIALGLGCSRDEPASTSHPAMPNQFEVGSTIDGRYRVLEKLGETGPYAVFAVEHVAVRDQPLALIAPRVASVEASRELLAIAARDRTLPVTAAARTPTGQAYVVAALGDDEIRALVSGQRALGE
jgi:hypothetical protein